MAVVSGSALVVYLAAAWYLTIVLRALNGDSLSRTGQAMFVVMSRDPHLGAIGFVWNPFPSLVQIPLVLALHPFGLQAFAGPLHSAMAMAGTVGFVWAFSGLYGLSQRWRAVLAALFALNPVILLYAANGMSEAIFLFFVVGTVYFFARWSRGGGYPMLIGMAVMSSAAFGARYETLPLAAAGAFALLVTFLASRDLEPARLEAILLAYLSPFAYVVFLWLFFNQLIMGDALFFLRSSYSNTAQTADFRDSGGYLQGVVHSVPGALRYAAARLFGIFPPFAALLAGSAIAIVVRRSWYLLGLTAFTLSIPLFHVVLLYGGASFGWLRFFMYSIPGAFLLAPPLISLLRRNGARTFALAAVALTFAASGVAGLGLLADPDVGREEHPFVAKLFASDTPLPPSRTFADDRAYLSSAGGLQASAATLPLPAAGINALGEPYFGGILGASVFTQPGESVTAYLTNSQAQFTDELWLVSPSVVFIGTNKDIPRANTLQVDLTKPIALGRFPAGAELVFAIHPNVTTSPFQPGFAANFRWGPSFGPSGWFGSPNDWFYSGSWTPRNSDGAPHERAQFFTGAAGTTIAGQSAAYLGFEDSRCCGNPVNPNWVNDPVKGADFNDAGLVVTRVSAATCRPKAGRSDGSEDLLTAGSGLSARRVSLTEIEISDGHGNTHREGCRGSLPTPSPTPKSTRTPEATRTPEPRTGDDGRSDATGTHDARPSGERADRIKGTEDARPPVRPSGERVAGDGSGRATRDGLSTNGGSPGPSSSSPQLRHSQSEQE